MTDDFQFAELIKTLGLPKNTREFAKNLFLQAVTHKSFLQDVHNVDIPNYDDQYDRLEFLGDSVLKLVMNENIFRQYPTYDSGDLTKLSAFLLSDKTLMGIAQTLGIKKFVRTGARIQPEAVLPDVMESLLGASYLSYGFDITGEFIIELYKDIIKEADASDLKGNYKAALQELTQSKKLGLPEYKVVRAEGPSHDPVFEVSVNLDGVVLGLGMGSSKKEAGQMAAKDALKSIQNKLDHV